MYKLFHSKSIWYNLRQLKYLPRAIKWRWQRAFRGWADCDTWSIDVWFLEVMPQMLRHLKENQMGFPILNTDVPEEENQKLWDDILDRMIFLLKEMDEEECSQQNEIWDEHYRKSMIGFDVELDREAYVSRQCEIDKYIQNCEKEFFELFAKHFRNLWD